MNTNRIITNAFSNPRTERLFRENWTERRMQQEHDDQQSCAFCFQTWRLGQEPDCPWHLCLNPKSPFHQETVRSTFSCSFHQNRERTPVASAAPEFAV
jgi:hypothetical protein